ncbi:MAG: cyclic nucleotide-binding domain-containing protein [Acidimicrobiales bacterium]
MKTIDQLVAAHPFTQGLSDEYAAIVAGCARNVALRTGTTLCVEGESADTFFLLRRGRVSIEVHQPAHGQVVIETVGPGGAVGWGWLVPPYRWTFDARALEPVGALAIDGACLRAKSLEDPALGYALLSRVSRELLSRLQATRLRFLDLYGGPND